MMLLKIGERRRGDIRIVLVVIVRCQNDNGADSQPRPQAETDDGGGQEGLSW